MEENVDITLKNGEICYSKFHAGLISKTDPSEIDDGTVFITQRRLVFKGKITLAMSMAKITACDSTPANRLSFHMENGNLITFDTKNILAPSIIEHIASIAGGAQPQDFSPLQENPARFVKQKIIEAPCLKPVRKKRKSRKNKITEDFFRALLLLIVIAGLYFYFRG